MQPFQRVKNEILATEELLGQRLPIIRQQYNEAKSAFYQPDLSGGGKAMQPCSKRKASKKKKMEGGGSWKDYLYEKGSEAAKYGKSAAGSVTSWGARKASDAYAKMTLKNAKQGAKQITTLAKSLYKSTGSNAEKATRNFTKAACEICDSPKSLAKKDLNNILYAVKSLYGQLAIIVSNFEHLQSELEKAEEDQTLLSLEDAKDKYLHQPVISDVD
jgi:hypothetical protein